MLNTVTLAGAVLFFVILAWFFRKTLKSMENPKFVLEGPILPRDLAALVVRLDKWKEEGRISREDYERFMHLCREDAERGKPLTKG